MTVAIGLLLMPMPPSSAEAMWSGLAISGPPTPDPYAPPPAIADADSMTPNIDTTLVADETVVDIGNGTLVNAQTYQSCTSLTACSGTGLIPGPTFKLDVGDTLTVRLVNHLEKPTGIHWHGAELANRSDGTPFTQNDVKKDHTLLYKFKAFRPGIFWYHPHHHASTNQTFRGLYGMIIVPDPNEAALITSGTLPSAANTLPVVLSDITVCKPVGTNDAATYDPSLPWVGGPTLPVQPGPTPRGLCETSPIDEEGNARPPYAAGDVPAIQRAGTSGRTNEGQTVLTNGVNVGHRGGTPAAPGALSPSAYVKNVAAGQGLRLQLLNAAVIRYMRLRLTLEDGTQVPLVRIGGEAGLLDQAIIEGGVVGGFDTKYGSGEILLPPGSRADVIAVIPTSAPQSSVLTLWTQDYCRTGMGSPCGWPNTPTVPVMHLRVMGSVPQFPLVVGTPLRAAIMGQAVETLGAPTATLLNPASFGKPGLSSQTIQLTATGSSLGVDNVLGTHEVPVTPANPTGNYALATHLASTRYARSGDTLQLSVTNTTSAHHPYHPHGFSIQPLSLTRTGFPTYTWPYREFRDNVDVPAGYTLNYRVRVDPRPLADGTTPGGELGRWLFHCHIFFHAVNGMISELVISNASGNEKPTVDVDGTWVYVAQPGVAVRHGRWRDPDGDPVTLTASAGMITQNPGGTWDWQLPTAGLPSGTQYVYITATDSNGLRDQVPFRLRIGGLDDGADNGEPHLTTTNGRNYDFQAAGEFTLLRDTDGGLEIQARQTPIGTASPITDPYSGLTSCVSMNTAVAAQLLSHRVAFQPAPAPPSQSGRQFRVFVDGKAVDITPRGLNVAPGARVVAIPLSSGGTSYEVDFPDSTVLTVTPFFWPPHQVWMLNVTVSRTPAFLGVLGDIPSKSWLPSLPNGTTVGPKPATLPARFVALNRQFANAWRVTDRTSLFVYPPGTSTANFTDRNWPPRNGPCRVNSKFGRALARATGPTLDRKIAERHCQPVTLKKLHADCVFDVAATGDPRLVKSYLQSQELALGGTTIRVDANREEADAGAAVTVVATVAALRSTRSTPTGSVVFLADGKVVSRRIALRRGQARATVTFDTGVHQIMASYTPSRPTAKSPRYLPSTSPIVLHTAVSRQGSSKHDHRH